MDKSAFFVGMDLGTYKTSVACSAGVREVLFSAVGRPKDQIARTMLGRDVVFGKDIVEHRLALDIVRPFERGVLKYATHKQVGTSEDSTPQRKWAAKQIVEQAVSLMRPPKGVPIYGIIGAPARASIGNKSIILEAARDAFDAVMIVSEPFSIAYGMNRLNDTLIVDIGAGTIDICPIYGTFPREQDQVTLPIGGDFVDHQFMHFLVEKYPDVQFSTHMIREIKEKHGFVHDVDERAITKLPVKGKPTEFDVTEPLKKACMSMVEPIVKGLCGIVADFDPEFQQRMLQNIILGGGGSQLKGLDRVIEEAMKEYGGAKVKRVYDAVFAGAVGALKLAMGMPRESWEQISALKKKDAPVDEEPLVLAA
jgi:rod shape-determining protein MreB and related proteins